MAANSPPNPQEIGVQHFLTSIKLPGASRAIYVDRPTKPRPFYIPGVPIPTDGSEIIAEGLGGGAIDHIYEGLRGIAGGIPITRRVGGESEIQAMVNDYSEQIMADVAGSEELLRAIGVDTKNVGADLAQWKKDTAIANDRENFWRYWSTRSPKDRVYDPNTPYGYFKVVGNPLTNPSGYAKSLIKQDMARRAAGFVEYMEGSGVTHTNVPFAAKAEASSDLQRMVVSKLYEIKNRLDYLESKARTAAPTLQVSGGVAGGLTTQEGIELARLRMNKKIINDAYDEYQREKDNPDPAKRNGLVSKVREKASEIFSEKGKVMQTWDEAQKGKDLYDKFQEARKHPVRWAFRKYVKPRIVKNIANRVGKRFGAKWGSRVENFLNSPLNSRTIARRGGELLNKYVLKPAFKQGWKLAKQYGGKLVKEAGKRALNTVLQFLKQVVWEFIQQVVIAVVEAVAEAIGELVAGVVAAVGALGGTVLLIILIVVAVIVLLIILIIILLSNPPNNTTGGGCTLTGSVMQMNSPLLLNYVVDTGNKLCVPPQLMLAEMEREAPGSFSWDDGQYNLYTELNWENQRGITDAVKQTGYCFNNSSGAEGITQFVQSTFDGYAAQVTKITGHDPADRCNAQDAVVALALKLKADSGTTATNCTNWDQATVYQVAGDYCGNHCLDQENVCGVDYCGGVYAFYQGFQSALVCTGGPSGPGHPEIVAADEAINACTYYPNECGFMVQAALTKAGYIPMVSANGAASGFLNAAATLGYQVFQLPGGPTNITPPGLTGPPSYNLPAQLPQPGDVVVWVGLTAAAVDGHTGIVTKILRVNNKMTVFVHSNLDCIGAPTYTGQSDTAFVVSGGNLVGSQLSPSAYQVLGFARVTAKVKAPGGSGGGLTP